MSELQATPAREAAAFVSEHPDAAAQFFARAAEDACRHAECPGEDGLCGDATLQHEAVGVGGKVAAHQAANA